MSGVWGTVKTTSLIVSHCIHRIAKTQDLEQAASLSCSPASKSLSGRGLQDDQKGGTSFHSPVPSGVLPNVFSSLLLSSPAPALP